MLFTRSIRRKMVFLLGLVAVMLLASSIAGTASLRWYYNAIRELDFSVNQMPRRGELDAAIGGLADGTVVQLRVTGFEPFAAGRARQCIVAARTECANEIGVLSGTPMSSTPRSAGAGTTTSSARIAPGVRGRSLVSRTSGARGSR